MRRVLTCALFAALLSACSVEAPAYRPTPTPAPVAAATVKPDILPLTYEVSPLQVRPGTVIAVTKTAIFFSNPNTFVLDWFMTVRFKSADGLAVSDERIGNAGVSGSHRPEVSELVFPDPARRLVDGCEVR